MASPALTAATAQLQRQFGPYLGTRPEVEHAHFGRGVLVGLPNCHINDGQPLGSVEFASQPGGHFPDYHELSGLKLVLYEKRDTYQVLRAWADGKPEHELELWAQAICYCDQLDRLARIVDFARALGIALNLPAGSYIRKELAPATPVAPVPAPDFSLADNCRWPDTCDCGGWMCGPTPRKEVPVAAR